MDNNRYYEDDEVSRRYLKYRPEYSPEVAERIVAYLKEKKAPPFASAVDIGCGTGQLTRTLAPHFASVLGVDISQAQITVADSVINPQNVFFKVGKAEDLPVPDSSVDLITSASASHYFDWVAFEKEIERVLRPNGCVAIVVYDLTYIDHPDPKTAKRITDCIESYMDYENDPSFKTSTPTAYQHIKDQRKSCELPLPYLDQKSMEVDVRKEMTVTELIECFKTFAVSVKYQADNPNTDRFEQFANSIMDILGEKDPGKTAVTARIPLSVRCARKTPEE